MDLANIARQVLTVAQRFKPLAGLLAGAPEAVEAVKSLRPLVNSVKDFADAPTKAELDSLEAEVFAGLDDTIDRLGDG